MDKYSEIKCPNCDGVILLEAKQLLAGVRFKCSTPTCDAAVSLSNASYQVTDDAMKAFDTLKDKL